MKLLRWRTRPRHIRKYGYAAQPAWHVCILCRTTSMYIDPGFAQLLALISLSSYSSFISFGSEREVLVGGFSSTVFLSQSVIVNIYMLKLYKKLYEVLCNE